MYDFTDYTATELTEAITATANQIAAFKAFPKLSKLERNQIAHDEAMLCEMIAELTSRDPL